jgi:hypothetical protein
MAEPRQPVTPESLASWAQEATVKRIALEALFTSPLETDRARAFDSMAELLLEAIKVVQVVAATKREHDERPA